VTSPDCSGSRPERWISRQRQGAATPSRTVRGSSRRPSRSSPRRAAQVSMTSRAPLVLARPPLPRGSACRHGIRACLDPARGTATAGPPRGGHGPTARDRPAARAPPAAAARSRPDASRPPAAQVPCPLAASAQRPGRSGSHHRRPPWTCPVLTDTNGVGVASGGGGPFLMSWVGDGTPCTISGVGLPIHHPPSAEPDGPGW